MDDGIEVPEAGRLEDLQDDTLATQAPGEVASPVLPELDESQDAELDTRTSKMVAPTPGLPNARPDH
jgi:hypothetical protein